MRNKFYILIKETGGVTVLNVEFILACPITTSSLLTELLVLEPAVSVYLHTGQNIKTELK